MEIEYKKFIPNNVDQIKDLTSYQCEINKRGQYLVRYLMRTETEIIVCDKKLEPLKIHKIYSLTKCKTRDDRFAIYKEVLDFIVSEIIKEKIFD